jgi:hypothetical protein
MNWVLDAEPAMFNGGEFCWAAIETRDCKRKRTKNGNLTGAYAKWHQEPVRNQLQTSHLPPG